MPGAVLFRDGATHEDVTQGALGDCYFLSAISVLGNDRIVKLFKCQEGIEDMPEEDLKHWKRIGAFMIVFYKNGGFHEVIVDDWLPVDSDGELVFTRSGQDGREMWPAIIEKAYAKLYGSYSNIEDG